MVVPVLMTSCQVSEKLNTGPVRAQTTMISAAPRNTDALPVQVDILLATLRNIFFMIMFSILST